MSNKISNTMADTKNTVVSTSLEHKNFNFLTYFHLLLIFKLTKVTLSKCFIRDFFGILFSLQPIPHFSLFCAETIMFMICFLFPLFISKRYIKCAIHMYIFCIFPVSFVLLLKGSVSRNTTDRGDRAMYCY